MKKITLSELVINSKDAEDIFDWDNQMKADPDKFKDIWMFNLEEGTYLSIREMIAANYEHFAIGVDERKILFWQKQQTAKLLDLWY